MLLSAVTMAETAAQDNEVLSQSAPAPASGDVSSSIMKNPNAQRFASVFKKSALEPREIYAKYMTFIVPQDSSCTPEDIKYLEGLTTKAAAREYILERAFLGSIENLRGRGTRAFSWLENGENSPPTETVIDEDHPYSAKLANGKSLTISIESEVLRVGSKGVVMASDDTRTGGIMYVNYCGRL